MIERVLFFILWLFIWMLLSWPIGLKDIVIGSFVSVFVTFMTTDIIRTGGDDPAGKKGFLPVFGILKRILWFIVYFMVFLWGCFKANLDVAWRVLHPSLPIRPGTIKVKTSLKSDIGLTFLANSITLTPGTTTIDIDKENGFIYVHMLCMKADLPAPDMELDVVNRLDAILKRIFE